MSATKTDNRTTIVVSLLIFSLLLITLLTPLLWSLHISLPEARLVHWPVTHRKNILTVVGLGYVGSTRIVRQTATQAQHVFTFRNNFFRHSVHDSETICIGTVNLSAQPTSLRSMDLLVFKSIAVHAGPTLPLLLVAFTMATMLMDKFVRMTYENMQARNIIAPRIPLRGIFSVKRMAKNQS